MNDLTPFITHSMDSLPGDCGRPSAVSSRRSPPLGRPLLAQNTLSGLGVDSEPLTHDPAVELPGQPADPGVKLPPPFVRTPHPAPGTGPSAQAAPTGPAIPYTDGTPAANRQKNAASFLQGGTPGVMAHYMPENNRVEGLETVPPRLARPTQEDDETVQRLVEWREEAPYG